MMKKAFIVVTVCSFIVAGLYWGTFAQEKKGAVPPKPPIKIGQMISTTGAYALTGQRCLPAIHLAVEEINAAGGILGGRKIEVVILDDGGIPERGASNMRKFAEDGCKGISGTPWSSVAIAANEVCYEKKLPIIHSSAMAPKAAWNQKSWGMNITIQLAETGNSKALQKYAPRPFKTVFLIIENQDWARGAAGWYKENWKGRTSAEPQIIGEEIVETNQTDFMSVLTKIKGSKADAILISDTAAPAEANLIKQAKEVGLPQMIFFVQGTLNVDTLKLAGPAANGVLSTETFWPEMPFPAAQAFIKQYKDKTRGNVPDKHACNSYCAIKHLVLAIDRAKSDNNYEAINKAILELTWDSPKGRIKLDGEHCRPSGGLYPVKAQDGKLVLLGEAVG
jgi:branched-chain amino acid transport system substrate-binding protein